MTQQDRTAVQYHKMTETPIPRLILSLAAPTILSMLITSIYNLADTFFVGRISTSASDAENFVFAPVSRAFARSLSKSSPVAPDTAATWLIEESKSDAVFTAATPRAVTAAETGRSFSPAEETLSPAERPFQVLCKLKKLT